MQEQQRDSVFRRGGRVHKMNIQSPETINVDRSLELRHLIQSSFFLPPIIARTPEFYRLPDLLYRHTIVFTPLLVGNVCGQARKFKFAIEKLELRVRDADLEPG